MKRDRKIEKDFLKKLEGKWANHNFCGEILDDAFDQVRERVQDYLTEEEFEEIDQIDSEGGFIQEVYAVILESFVRYLARQYKIIKRNK
jgi:hypothetical protein